MMNLTSCNGQFMQSPKSPDGLRSRRIVRRESIQSNSGSARGRAARLFAALGKSRNTEPVGPLRREKLYDRQVPR